MLLFFCLWSKQKTEILCSRSISWTGRDQFSRVPNPFLMIRKAFRGVKNPKITSDNSTWCHIKNVFAKIDSLDVEQPNFVYRDCFVVAVFRTSHSFLWCCRHRRIFHPFVSLWMQSVAYCTLNAACASYNVCHPKNYVCLYDIIYRQQCLVKRKKEKKTREKFRVKYINRSEREINIIETYREKNEPHIQYTIIQQ